MNNKLRTESKNYFEKDFFKPMNNAVFGKNNAKCKKEEINQLQNLIIINKIFFRQFNGN